MVGRRKMTDLLLNCIFNVPSIYVIYILSLLVTNFSFKCLYIVTWKNYFLPIEKKIFQIKKNYYIHPNEKTIFQIKTASFTSNYIFVTSDKIHCTKNHISQVLEYQEKPQKGHVKITFLSTFWLKKRPYFPLPKSSKQKLFSYQQILYFHLLFDSKKDLIFHLRKIRNKKILVISKHLFPY